MNKCKGCGSEIFFSPKDKGNKCPSCGSVYEIEYIYNFVKKPFSEHQNLKVDNLAKNSKSIRCESCGASMVLNKLQTQSSCPYCGNTSVVESRTNNLLYIDSVIPFAFSKQDALTMFKANLSQHFFADKKVFAGITEKNISGIYVNAFVFDMITTSTYSGEFSYTETVKDKDGNTEWKTVYKHVNGTFNKNFVNLTVEANSHLNQADLHEIMPFEYKSAVDFKEDFMNGYLLEYENSMLKDCTATAESLIKKQIEKDLLRKHNCDRIVSLNLTTNYLDRKYNY